MKKLTIACMTILCLCAGTASAQERTEVVKFDSGAISKTIKGSIKGYDGVSYILGAKAGQAMSVLFAPANASCNMNVWRPGEEQAVFAGDGNEYAANLDKTGDYRVQVYLMRNAAQRNEVCNFTITFEISG
jgi:hypothetical protein